MVQWTVSSWCSYYPSTVVQNHYSSTVQNCILVNVSNLEKLEAHIVVVVGLYQKTQDSEMTRVCVCFVFNDFLSDGIPISPYPHSVKNNDNSNRWCDHFSSSTLAYWRQLNGAVVLEGKIQGGTICLSDADHVGNHVGKWPRTQDPGPSLCLRVCVICIIVTLLVCCRHARIPSRDFP